MKSIPILFTVMLVAFSAIAGTVYNRSIKVLSRTSGSGTWTNNLDVVRQGAIELKRIDVVYSYLAANTVTVSRVTSDLAYTQAVGTVTVSAGSGTTATFTHNYLWYDDMLTFSSEAATGSTIMVEYEIQKF